VQALKGRNKSKIFSLNFSKKGVAFPVKMPYIGSVLNGHSKIEDSGVDEKPACCQFF